MTAGTVFDYSESLPVTLDLLRYAEIAMTVKSYIEHRDRGYWVRGTRVSLDSLVHALLEGQNPETIAQSFPAVTLEEVYGAITFDLANREEVDAYLTDARSEYDRQADRARMADRAFYAKLDAARDRQPA